MPKKWGAQDISDASFSDEVGSCVLHRAVVHAAAVLCTAFFAYCSMQCKALCRQFSTILCNAESFAAALHAKSILQIKSHACK